jgi:hypothetical protein
MEGLIYENMSILMEPPTFEWNSFVIESLMKESRSFPNDDGFFQSFGQVVLGT